MPAGHFVSDAADFVKEMTRRPLLDQTACMVSLRTVDDQMQVSSPGVSFRYPSDVTCWFAAPSIFHACKVASTKNFMDPGEDNARSIVKKLRGN